MKIPEVAQLVGNKRVISRPNAAAEEPTERVEASESEPGRVDPT